MNLKYQNQYKKNLLSKQQLDNRTKLNLLTAKLAVCKVATEFSSWLIKYCLNSHFRRNLMTEGGGNVLFNDTLNTFYLRLYGGRHMVKDHSDIERGNLLPPHGLLFWLTARVLLYAPSHRQNKTYHSLCYTSHGALAGTRNSSMGPLHEGSIRRSITPWVNALTTSHDNRFYICKLAKYSFYLGWALYRFT